MQATCERIQHYGQLYDDQAATNLTETQALNKLEPLLTRVKKEFKEAELFLTDYYKKLGVKRPED